MKFNLLLLGWGWVTSLGVASNTLLFCWNTLKDQNKGHDLILYNLNTIQGSERRMVHSIVQVEDDSGVERSVWSAANLLRKDLEVFKLNVICNCIYEEDSEFNKLNQIRHNSAKKNSGVKRLNVIYAESQPCWVFWWSWFYPSVADWRRWQRRWWAFVLRRDKRR